MVILDAGCGLLGSAVYFASNLPKSKIHAVSNGGLYPEYLGAISNYEVERFPSPFSREVSIICGTFQNYKIYNGQTNTVIATSDTNYWVHDN